ncbi:hypothetical protein [Vibrio coralliirubri]|uniref:hypothetical protein n=1 Tax=Vibrio coralliirubri TaxID=1516159 RepID=UPI002FE4064C
MNLIAIVVSRYKSIEDTIISLDHRFNITELGKEHIEICKNGKDNYHYYGNSQKWNLVLGNNGAGKTTCIEIIESFFKNKTISACYIWESESNLFVYDPSMVVGEISSDISIETIFDPQKFISDFNVNLIKISNSIDISKYVFNELQCRDDKNYINLSSNRVIRKPKKSILSGEVYSEIEFVSELFDVENGIHKPRFQLQVFGSNLSLIKKYIVDISLKNKFNVNEFVNKIEEILIQSTLSEDLNSNTLSNQYSLNKKDHSSNQEYLSACLNTIFKKLFSCHKTPTDAIRLFLFSNFLELGLLNKSTIDSEELEYHYTHKFIDLISNVIDKGFISANDTREFLISLYSISKSMLNKSHEAYNDRKRVLNYIDDAINTIYPIDSYINDIKAHFKKHQYNIERNIFKMSLSDISDITRVRNMIIHNPSIKELTALGWSGISSGEEAKIKLLSRLTFGIEALKKQNRDSSYIVLIDEVDLYLSPKWQRDIVSDLIKYSNKCLSDDDNVHFLVTSHSPIIASDILPCDIFRLGSESEPDDIKGFGSNIKDLYISSFDIRKTIGRLSLSKIDELIESADSGSLSKKDIDVVSLIGSDFIRKYILSKVNDDKA